MNVRYTKQQIKAMKSKTDWDRLNLMTDAEILAAARSDPDAQPLTAKELKQFKKVSPASDIDVAAIRHKLRLSQEDFANYFGVSKRTVQEWEQHRRTPTATARNFLKVVEREPKAVRRALQ